MNRLSDAPVRAERGRVAYLDMLRIAATVAVVMIHVAVRGWRSMDMHTAQWHALSFFSSISRWGTPIFVMISGALFLDERREVRLRRLFSKNILRILIAFVFWSAVYAVPFFLRDRSVFGLISNFLTGSYQLWFLYMIVGLYLITPLLRRITSDRSALRYFLLLSLCFTFLLPMLGKAIRLADILLHKDGALYAGLTTGYSNMKFYFTLGYVPYFLLGHALNTAQLSKKAERVIYALGLLGFAATVWGTEWLSRVLGAPCKGFMDEMTLNVLLQSAAVFTFAKCRLSAACSGKRGSAVVRSLSKCSFGIFLVHPGVLSILERLGFRASAFPAAIGAVIVTAGIFAISYGLSAILNAIPIVKKYLV